MKKILYSVLFIIGVFASCQKDILDKTDLSGIDERIWSDETSATLYLNNLYSLIMPTFPSSFATSSDESNSGNAALLGGTLSDQQVGDFSATTYQNIRKINLLLREVEKGSLSQASKTKIKSQAYFLRAFKYFELVKLYGGVPYVTTLQDWITDDLYVSRNKTSECIELIVKDLDSAALAPKELIATQTGANRGRITRYAALGLKGRVLLYWASPQFVGPNTSASDLATRWENAYQANKLAYDEMLAAGHALFPNFANVLTDESSANKELIMIRSFGITNYYNSFETSSRPSSMGSGGSNQPTLTLVNAFPMSDGTSISTSPNYDPELYYKNRDPRFNATIAYNGSLWALGGQSNLRIWTFTNTSSELSTSSTGFYNKKGVNLSATKDLAANGSSDWVEMRFAEVILNLAECAANTNRISEAYDMLKLIRARAGITANANGFYGLTENMSVSDMNKAIWLERQIELAFEGKRYQDLRRTRLFTVLTQYNYIRETMVTTAKAPWQSVKVPNASNNHINLNGTATVGSAAFIREESDVNTKGATGTAVIVSGSISSITVLTPGSGYATTATPRVTIGSAWTASTSFTLNKQLFYGDNLYTVTTAGTSNTVPPTHVSGVSTSTNGTTVRFTYVGKVAKARAIVGALGTISGFEIQNAGSGYTSAPTVVVEGYNTYFNTAKGTLNPKFNYLDKYYFYDIPSDNINKNPKILQNIGWVNGSFDPYQ